MKQPALARWALCGWCALAQTVAADTFSESFDYPDDSAGEPAWRPDSAAWGARDGAIGFVAGDRCFLVFDKGGAGKTVSVEAILTLQRRAADGWAIAGVAVHTDPANFWHFAVVEAPPELGARHSVELVEAYEGRWLANFEGPTKLRQTIHDGGDFAWEYHHPYRMRIDVSAAGVEGRLEELDGTLRTHIGFAFADGQPAVRNGFAALDAAALAGTDDDARITVSDPLGPADAANARTNYPPYAVAGFQEVRGRKTGFFHVEDRSGTAWVIDPNGSGFYSVGVDHANFNGHNCQKLGYSPYLRNAQAKYGGEDAWAAATAERLRAWGFNTLSAGHSQSLRYRSFAHVEWVGAGRSFADIDALVPRTTWTGFPNVFSARWARHCDIAARRLCAPNRNDPWLLGYFLDNELQWFGALGNWRDEYGLWNHAWMKPPSDPAKQAWLDVVRAHCATIEDGNRVLGTQCASFDELAASTNAAPPVAAAPAKAMVEDFMGRVAERYFGEMTRAIRRHDPNHLILGCRFAGWAPSAAWSACGKHCDIVSLNMYPRIDVERGVAQSVVDELRAMQVRAAAPLMVTEWSFPALDSGLPCRYGAGMRVATQSQRAACFRSFQGALASLPFIVGSDYFMYLDEPALGISDTFPEDSNYGLIDEQDEPWAELVTAAAAINPRVPALHAAGKLDSVFAPRPLTWLPKLPPPGDAPGDESGVVRCGQLELAPADGTNAWRIRFDGQALGAYGPLLHQSMAGNLWVSPESSRVTAWREDEAFTVVDMEFARVAGGEAITTFDPKSQQRIAPADGPGAFRAGWRFWIPKSGAGWFGAQSLWVENTDARAWTLSSIYHYTRPAIGGSPENDVEGLSGVPNFYMPLGAWEDRTAGYGIGVLALDDALAVSYWKAADGFHADCRQPIDRLLKPGERYEIPGPIAIHFGYRIAGDRALLDRAGEVSREARAYVR